ncbi:MAG: DUF2786 domain-containing protein [Actinophytocola sp.]|nr:DUF2786 domain-containing protein [Actinophytocola sp.]
MGKRNREKRAAKRRDRRRQGATPPGSAGGTHRREFPWEAGNGTDDPDRGEPFSQPPPPTTEALAIMILGAAQDYQAGDAGSPNRCAAQLSAREFAGQRTVAIAAAIAFATMIDKAWKSGWLPIDVVELIKRRSNEAAVSLLVDAIAADTAEHAPATVPARWAAQVEQLDATVWWRHDEPHLMQWMARYRAGMRETLVAAIELLGRLMTLPKLPRILPLPGTASRDAATSAAGVNQKVLARVRGLLAKAESTEFPEEAEALSAKAQELMNRHAFERALLDADAHHQQSATSIRMWLDNPYAEAKSHLVAAIADANRCRSVFYAKIGFVALVGEEMDLEITELLATSLLVQATRAMVAEGSQTTFTGTSRTRSFRRSFLISYAVRIGERLADAGTRAHDPVEDARLLPVLAARSRVVEETFEEMIGETVRKRVSISNGAGWDAGRTAADRADLDIERRAVERV